MRMQVPQSERKRALAVIHVQEAFINPSSQTALANIRRLLRAVPYSAYIKAVFSAGEGSLWDVQTGWTLGEKHACSTTIRSPG
jgi:hypothetical protein